MAGQGKSCTINILRKIFDSNNKKINNKSEKKNETLNTSVGPENDILFERNICFEGPPDSLYKVFFIHMGGIFQAVMTFPDDYPNNPPKMVLKTQCGTPIYIPRIRQIQCTRKRQ